jgi:hypothetical protein
MNEVENITNNMGRKLIVGERIMYVDALTPLNGVFAVKIQGNISLNILNTALCKIQQKHYLLRTTIRKNKKGELWFVPDLNINKIPVRIVERAGEDDWMAESKKEWEKLFDGVNDPMARLVWIKGEEASDLLLICPHCISDGTAFVSLMSDLLMLIDEPDNELVSYPAYKSVKDLVAHSFTATPQQVIKTKVIAGLAKLFFLFKSLTNKHPVGDSYMLHWKLGTAETASLMTKCKANGVTVHAALCVAFLDAFRFVNGNTAHGKVISPVDIRRFISEIKDDHLFAFAPIAELSIDKSTAAGFWLKAKKLKDGLANKIAAMKVYELLVMSEYFHASVSKMIKFLKVTEGTHDVTLSNMGRLNIPQHYHTFNVSAVYSPTLAFPWRNSNTAVISTFNGEMDFCFCSNSAFLPIDQANNIRDKVLNLLRETV